MLTAAKNQLKVTLLSIKYGIMRELLNRATFISNTVFMMLNNASFVIQWLVLYSIKSGIGGYTFNQVMILWAIASLTYGLSHFIFKKAYNLSNIINTGMLDGYLVQPKNVLLSCITSDVESSSLGDILYGIIVFLIIDHNILHILLFIFVSILGSLIITSFAVIFGSISFYNNKSDIIADRANGIMTNFATYPDGIFKGVVRVLLFTIIPVGIANYLPVRVLTDFNIYYLLIIFSYTIFSILVAFLVFYTGLRRYSSTNLMNVRV